MRRAEVHTMIVVVPVRDEERLLGACLSALTTAVDAARREEVHCEVRIVLDACTDASEQIAARSGLPLLICDAARVGIARAVGIDDALRAVPEWEVLSAHLERDFVLEVFCPRPVRSVAQREGLV